MLRHPSFLFLVYGLAVFGSAAIRCLLTGAGTTGLWFGAVMGSLALGSSAWIARRETPLAYLPGGLALLFVGGWFAYECFVRHGLAAAEPRQLAILLLTLVVAALLLAGRRKRAAR